MSENQEEILVNFQVSVERGMSGTFLLLFFVWSIFASAVKVQRAQGKKTQK